MDKEQSAAIYLLNDGSYIVTVDSFVRPHGPWILNQDAIRLKEVSSTQLGQVVIDALGRSEWGIEEPESFNALDLEHLRSAGVNSWRELQAGGSKCVVFSLKKGNLTLLPTRNNKTFKKGMGFVHLPDRAVASKEVTDPSAVGELVARALQLSE